MSSKCRKLRRALAGGGEARSPAPSRGDPDAAEVSELGVARSPGFGSAPAPRSPGRPLPGLPGPAGAPVPPRGLRQAAAPGPRARLARIRPAAAARAQPLLPR